MESARAKSTALNPTKGITFYLIRNECKTQIAYQHSTVSVVAIIE
jgi:hypothetical protein